MAKQRAYNLRMIRDFLDHVTWQLICSHLELSGGMSEEVAEKLRKHQYKYRCGSLRAIRIVDPPNPEAERRYRAEESARIDEQLEMLELLRPVLDEALWCVRDHMAEDRTADERPVILIDAADYE